MDTNEITRSACDDCHSHRPGVTLHDGHGTPVIQVCSACEPLTFERQARKDIDAWLAGGDACAFGR